MNENNDITNQKENNEQKNLNASMEIIQKVLSAGQLAKVKLYQNLLQRISKGENLNSREIELLNRLERELEQESKTEKAKKESTEEQLEKRLFLVINENPKCKELIKIVSETDRGEMEIISGAVENTRGVYAGQPTAGNKKDWDAAREGFETLVDRLWRKYFPEAERFDNLLAVLKHLQGKGYKIRKSKIYQDRKKGLVSVQADGTVLKKDAERYAKKLNKLASSEAAADAGHQHKLQQENEMLGKRNALLQLELDQKKGELMSRKDADFEKASNVAVIIASLNQYAEMEAGNLVEIAAGDAQRRPHVVKALVDGFAEMFNRLVQAETYQLSIEGELAE